MIILVKAGAPVDSTIAGLCEHMEEGDIIIDGGNEWYENTERRQAALAEKGIIEIGMGVSGGEEGARRGEIIFFCFLASPPLQFSLLLFFSCTPAFCTAP